VSVADNMTARLEALGQGVLGPLVLGGQMRLVPPLGAELGLEIGIGRRISDDDLRSRVDVARVRRARLVAPLDTLPDISPAEWSLVAVLNDALQATNHELSGAFTKGRHAKVLESASRLVAAIPRPRSTLEVIVRYATFARLFEIERTDTHVTAWAGSATYRGQKPDRSMVFWPSLRRVSVEPRRTPLPAMTEGLPAVSPADYLRLIGELVARSPLSDLASAHRVAPPFAWTRFSLELVSYPTGRALALRAMARAPAQPVVAAIQTATNALAAGTAARSIAESFAFDLLDRAQRAPA